jgi:ATP-dependent RNA helicase DDX5/DBP2
MVNSSNGKSESGSSSSKHRRRRKEQEDLQDSEHVRESKRLRTYSKDDIGNDGARTVSTSTTTAASATTPVTSTAAAASASASTSTGRLRTRSMDAAEERKVKNEMDEELTPDEWRKEHGITIRGHGAERNTTEYLAPFKQFKQAPFCDKILQAFTKSGFEKPTPIQSQAWPIALQNKDMICIAKTGSGKTCGFLLPVFHQHLQTQAQTNNNATRNNFQSRTKPLLLVLAPTRELSVQILEEATKFGRPLGIRSVCCYGGSSKWPQISSLERGVECIIATPGRLNDLLEMKKCDLSQIQHLVLDEADRMLVRLFLSTSFFLLLYTWLWVLDV